jgi:hypothetical protein
VESLGFDFCPTTSNGGGRDGIWKDIVRSLMNELWSYGDTGVLISRGFGEVGSRDRGSADGGSGKGGPSDKMRSKENIRLEKAGSAGGHL